MYFLFSYLAQPYVLLLLLLGVLQFWSYRKLRCVRSTIVLLLPYSCLLLISLPVVAHFLVGSLEWRFPHLQEIPQDTEAIVVLGAGLNPGNVGRSSEELSSASVYRCLRAAQLYAAASTCPVLVVGGKLDPTRPGPSDADLMVDLLRRLGVAPADLLVDNQSRTTFQNAQAASKLLFERGLTRVVLVTDAIHQFRAVHCFHKLGLVATPAPCSYRTTTLERRWTDMLPDISAVNNIQAAVHEWLGIAWYWWHGRI